MIKSLLIFMSLLNITNSFAQDSTQAQTEHLSFASGYFGSRSEVLIETENYIEHKSYDKLLLMLESKSVTEQFIGSIICRRLAEDYKMILLQSQMDKIKSIEKSDQKIIFQAGCTCHVSLSIRDYFAGGENPCGFKKAIDNWILELKNKYA